MSKITQLAVVLAWDPRHSGSAATIPYLRNKKGLEIKIMIVKISIKEFKIKLMKFIRK